MAGIVGVEPGQLTLRELVVMAEARARAAWDRTSLLCALIANANRDPKKTRPCKPEADAHNVTDEDFGRAMAGDAIDLAATALLEELVGFFPQGRRKLLAKALEKLRTLEAMALQAAQTRLESPELQRELEAALGSSSGSSPASSGSSPVP